MKPELIAEILAHVANHGIQNPVIYCHPQDAESVKAVPEFKGWETVERGEIEPGAFMVTDKSTF